MPDAGPKWSNQPTIVYADNDHVTGSLGNVLISFSKAEPTLSYLQNWLDVSTKLVAKHGHMVAINIIDAMAKPPTDAVRDEINRLILLLSDGIVGIALVPEGTGFLAAAKRSALSMVTLISRRPFPIRVFGEVPEAANWAIAQLRTGATTPRIHMRELADAAKVVRAALSDTDAAQPRGV
jgi:hypothetical protein